MSYSKFSKQEKDDGEGDVKIYIEEEDSERPPPNLQDTNNSFPEGNTPQIEEEKQNNLLAE